MQHALESLPWVEKGSVKVSKTAASFKVIDPKQFKLQEAQSELKEENYTASLAKAGSAIPVQ